MEPVSTAIGMYELALLLVPFIVAGHHQLADETSQLAFKLPNIDFSQSEPNLQQVQAQLTVINNTLDALSKATQAIAQDPEKSNALAEQIQEHIDHVSSNLKLTDADIIRISQAFLEQIRIQSLETIRTEDPATWQKLINNPDLHNNFIDTYQRKNQFLHDQAQNSFYNNLDFQRKNRQRVALQGAVLIGYILYQTIKHVRVSLKKRKALKNQEIDFDRELSQKPLMLAAYKYAHKHIVNQAVMLVSDRNDTSIRAEHLILLNQVNIQGTFGRLCVGFVERLNSLLINERGHIDFVRLNDEFINRQIVSLFKEFIRAISLDQESFLSYCKIASKLYIAGMQEFLDQAENGKKFFIGEPVWTNWFKEQIGLQGNTISQKKVNNQLYNQDFLKLIKELHIAEFNPNAHLENHYQNADNIRLQYSKSVANMDLANQTNDDLVLYAANMNNLYGYYLHKNNLSQNAVNLVFINREYGLKFAEIKQFEQRFGITSEMLSIRFKNEEQTAFFKKIIQEIRKLLGGPRGPRPNKIVFAALFSLMMSLVNENHFQECTYLQDIFKFLCGVDEGIREEGISLTIGLSLAFVGDKALKIFLPTLSQNPTHLACFYSARGLIWLAALYGLKTKWDDFALLIQAIQLGAIQDIGKFGFRSVVNFTDFSKLIKQFTEAKLIPNYALNGADYSNDTRKIIFERGSHSAIDSVNNLGSAKNLLENVKKSSWYQDSCKEFITLTGTNQAAFENRIKQICASARDNQMVQSIVSNVKKSVDITLKNTFIPKGLLKALKIDHWHFAFPNILKSGKLQGFHFDPFKSLHDSANFKCLYEETAPNGFYRCLIELDGFLKGCTMFPKSWSVEKTLDEVYKALNAVDYSKMTVLKNGKYHVKIDFHGAKLEAFINKSTSEISTFFISHDNWQESIYDAFKRTKK